MLFNYQISLSILYIWFLGDFFKRPVVFSSSFKNIQISSSFSRITTHHTSRTGPSSFSGYRTDLIFGIDYRAGGKRCKLSRVNFVCHSSMQNEAQVQSTGITFSFLVHSSNRSSDPSTVAHNTFSVFTRHDSHNNPSSLPGLVQGVRGGG